MRTAWPKRLLWLIALWGGSVLTLAAISLLFRLLMTAAWLEGWGGWRGVRKGTSPSYLHFCLMKYGATSEERILL